MAVAVGALICLGACGMNRPNPGAGPAGTPSINVSGVLDYQHRPVCFSGEPCDPAHPPMYVVFTHPGGPDVRAQLGPGGAFEIHLEPGFYTILVAPPQAGARLTPDQVRVPAEGKVNLDLLVT